MKIFFSSKHDTTLVFRKPCTKIWPSQVAPGVSLLCIATCEAALQAEALAAGKAVGFFYPHMQHSCVPRLLVALLNEKPFFFSMFCRAFGQQACKLLMQQHSNVEPLISSPLMLHYGKTSILLRVALIFLVQCGNSKQLCEEDLS